MVQSRNTSMILFFYLRNLQDPKTWNFCLRGSLETGSEFVSGRMVARIKESDLILLKAKLEPFLCRAIPSGSDLDVTITRI